MSNAKTDFSAEDCRKGLEKLRQTHKHLENVTGFDVGYRWTDGLRTDTLCLRVHVTAKQPHDRIDATQVIAKEIGGIPVDVITGPYRAHKELGFGEARRDTAILSGSSCKRTNAGSGTVGAIAIDRKTGAAGILSNWHVLSTHEGKVGDLIYDEGGDQQPIATLAKSMLSRHGDAAFAPLTGLRPWYPALKELNINLSGVSTASIGQVLCKYGRATGLTRARVDGAGIYRVKHEVLPGEFQLIEMEGFRLVPEDPASSNAEISLPGDSGACWVNPDSGAVVGLHMAGDGETLPEGEFALACDMQTILDQMDLKLATLDDLLARGLVAGRPAPAKDVPPMRRALWPIEQTPMAGFARPQSGTALSVSGNIWSEVRRVTLQLYPHLAETAITLNDALADTLGDGNAPALARRIILNSPLFRQDGATPSLYDLRLETDFRGVCVKIAEEYRALGFVVTS